MSTMPATINRSILNWPAMANVDGAIRCTPTSGLVLHWDGNGGLVNKLHSECVKYWINTRKFHMNGRGWLDIGYAWGICPHGGRFEGRGWGWVQAAQPGGNSTWESCTLMLGPGEMPTPEQIDSVRRLRDQLMLQHGLKEEIRPHSHFISTNCPGPIISRMITDGTFLIPPRSENWLERAVKTLPTLRLGDASPDVKTARALLYARGYVSRNEGTIKFLDSQEYDTELLDYIKFFQAKKKLVSDGIVGPLTWAKLFRR